MTQKADDQFLKDELTRSQKFHDSALGDYIDRYGEDDGKQKFNEVKSFLSRMISPETDEKSAKLTAEPAG